MMMESKADCTHDRANMREVALTVLSKAPNQSNPFSCDVIRVRVRRTSSGIQNIAMIPKAVENPESNQYNDRL